MLDLINYKVILYFWIKFDQFSLEDDIVRSFIKDKPTRGTHQ